MKMHRSFIPVLVAATSFAAATPLHAATLVFDGSASATAMVGMDPTCAPLPFRGVITHGSSSGTSNLGNFTYSHNACTQGATGPVLGSFELLFGSSLLSGAFEGASAARVGTPGLFDQQFTYTVTGGTGTFAGASGTFTNMGTVDTRGGPPSRLALNFVGTINAPAVPEPATWGMILLGFGFIGGALRSTKRRQKRIIAYS